MPARLYYELHVTVDAAESPGGWDVFKSTAASELPDWRVSKFSEDEVDDYHGKWFLSARTEEDSYKYVVRDAVHVLQEAGYVVIRWKVEDTLLDSKYGDVFV